MTHTPNNFKQSFSGGLPREEFEKSGGNAAALTSEKLLAILLKTGAPGCNVMELSHRLVSAFGGTGHLVRANFIQLKEQIGRYNKQHPDKRIVGIGKVKLMELAAAFELVRREYAVRDDDVRKVDVITAESRYQVFRRVLNPDDRQENFAVLLVDNKLHPLTDPLVITRGTMNGTMVHPREVFQEAVRWGAHAVMVAHNHPSGDPEPSGKDIELTKRLMEVSKVMAIPLYDHIVLGAVGSAAGKGYVSFRDRRLVDFER